MGCASELEDIIKYVDQHADEFVEDLRRFVRQPSIAAEGLGIKDCAEMLVGYLKALGAQVELVQPEKEPGSPVVYAELNASGSKRSKKTLLYYSHYDVEPARPELWKTPPFEAQVIHNRIVGRGALDAKGIWMSFIKAIESIIAVTGSLPINMIFCIEGEEEIGSPNLPSFVKKYQNKLGKADALFLMGICPEGKGKLANILGFKGTCYLELEARSSREDARPLHGRYAAIIDNPVWELIWALNSMKDARDEIVIDGFYESIPSPSAQEIEMLEEVLRKTSEEDNLRRDLRVKKFRKDLRGIDLLKELYLAPTLNINGFVSGQVGVGVEDVCPAFAKARLDIKTVPNIRKDELVLKIKNHLKKHGFEDINVRILGGIDWAKTPVGSDIGQAIRRAAARMDLELVTYPSTAGPLPAALFSDPPLNLPFAKISGIGVKSDFHLMHAPNEYLEIGEYINSIKFAVMFLCEFAQS